jgi:hypothetical protein
MRRLKADKRAERLEKAAALLSNRMPVGTPVRFWTMARGDGPGKRGTIKAPFSVLGGHTVVAWISGAAGCIDAGHIERVEE